MHGEGLIPRSDRSVTQSPPGASAGRRLFPDRYYALRQEQFRWMIGRVLILGIVSLGGVALTCWTEFPAVLAALALALFTFTLAADLLSWNDTSRWVRIIPYFERRVGEIDTFLAGESLARQFLALEKLAAKSGCRPLSDFGFNDDLAGESLVWHPAEAGLETVRTLREEVTHDPGSVPDAAAVDADLERWQYALARARDTQIPFCVLLRVGNATCAQEWEVRRGTAF